MNNIYTKLLFKNGARILGVWLNHLCNTNIVVNLMCVWT